MSALKRRPIVWALIFWAAGSLAALYSGTVSGFIAASLACCGLACLIFFLIKRPFAFIYIAFFFLGALLTARSLAPRDPAADALADSGETLTMSGVVLDVSKTSTGKLAFTYKCTRVDGQKAGFVVSAVLIDGDTAEIGQSLVLSAKLAKPGRAANPGDFDDFLYYKARKVDYTAYPAILSKGGVSVSANSVLSFVRNKIEDVYDAIFPPEQAGLVKSIVLGDKSGLDDDTKELYRAAGVYHVLCVSGLHISIISGAIYLLLKRLKGQKLRGLLTLAVVAAYTVMTGASVPAVRALVMAAVVIAGRLLYRERDLPSSVAFACLCLLAYEPLYLLDAGFQISFTAVFGIAALARPLEREFGRRGLGKVKGAAGSSAAATLGMFPVTCWHFYTFQTYSILTNMIILPTMSLLVIAAIITGVAGLFSLTAASFAAGSVYYLLKFYDAVCHFFGSLPLSSLLTGRLSVPLYALAYAAVLALAFWLSARKANKVGKTVFICLLAAFAALFAYDRYGGGLRVTEFASRADGCPIAVRGNQAVLFDSGLSASEPPDYLNYLGLDGVAGVFLARPDGSSAAMVSKLAAAKKIRALFVPPGWSGAYPSGTKVVEIRAGDTVEIGGMKVRVLGPDGSGAYAFEAVYGGAGFLFADGLDWDRENVVQYIGGISPDALFLPAKSDKSGNMTGPLLDAVLPSIAVAGTGANGKSAVSQATADELAARGVPLYDTTERGAVTISVIGGKIAIETMLYYSQVKR